MKIFFLAACLLAGTVLAHAQKTVLTAGANRRVYDPREPSIQWALSPGNKTVGIVSAYKTGSLVVVIGRIDAESGEVVTVLDAASKQEKFEFLCNEAQSSGSGRWLAFTRFYPHFGTAEISDRVQVLDLENPGRIAPPDAQFHIPSEEAGVTVYPQEAILPGQRRRVYELKWKDASLSFTDHLERLRPEGGIEELSVCSVQVSPSPEHTVSRICAPR